jgi:hypothetical protein
MTQLDEELSRRAEELKRLALDVSQDLRRFAADFADQMQILAEDLRKRSRVPTTFEPAPIEKIRALAELRDEGIISENEFQEQKARLLEQV